MGGLISTRLSQIRGRSETPHGTTTKQPTRGLHVFVDKRRCVNTGSAWVRGGGGADSWTEAGQARRIDKYRCRTTLGELLIRVLRCGAVSTHHRARIVAYTVSAASLLRVTTFHPSPLGHFPSGISPLWLRLFNVRHFPSLFLAVNLSWYD